MKHTVSLSLVVVMFFSSITNSFALTSSEIESLYKKPKEIWNFCDTANKEYFQKINEFVDVLEKSEDFLKEINSNTSYSLIYKWIQNEEFDVAEYLMSELNKIVDASIKATNPPEYIAKFFKDLVSDLERATDKKSIIKKAWLILSMMEKVFNGVCYKYSASEFEDANLIIYKKITQEIYTQWFIEGLLNYDFNIQNNKISNIKNNIYLLNVCKINPSQWRTKEIQLETEKLQNYLSDLSFVSQRKNYYLMMVRNAWKDSSFTSNFLNALWWNTLKSVENDINKKFTNKEARLKNELRRIKANTEKYIKNSQLGTTIQAWCTKKMRDYATSDKFPYSYEMNIAMKLFEVDMERMMWYKYQNRQISSLSKKELNDLYFAVFSASNNETIKQIARWMNTDLK